MANPGHAGDGLTAIDPYDIGWWIEAADEEIYGPVSRATLRRFLAEGKLTPNTLVRHAIDSEARPIADQAGMMEGVKLDPAAPATGDRMAEAWPRKWREQVALAEGTVPCARHKRPAVLFCLRCQAPYCNRCRAKPYKKAFFFCRKCQSSNYNRRAVAFIGDSLVINYGAILLAAPIALVAGESVIILAQIAGGAAFIVRDAVFAGAGPGKRLLGLRVVESSDGITPVGYPKAVLRWLSLAIPFFNLVDLSVPFRDPLQRRYGDRWAKTRVIDSDRAIKKARHKVRQWLAKKGFTLATEVGMLPAQFAQLV